jgi:hypothetical protein
LSLQKNLALNGKDVTFEDNGKVVEEGFDDLKVLLQHLLIEYHTFISLSLHDFNFDFYVIEALKLTNVIRN